MDVSVPLHTESEDNTLTRHANWRVALTNLERIRDVDLHHRHASLLDPFTPLVLQIRPSQPSARIKNNASITACTSTAEEATNEVLIVWLLGVHREARLEANNELYKLIYCTIVTPFVTFTDHSRMVSLY